MDAQSILVQFDHLFQVQNIFFDMLRALLWLIVQGLARLNGFVQDIATEILTLNGFIDYSGITSIYEEFKPLFFAIMGIALVASGYMLMFGSQSTSKLAKNVLFAVVVVTMLPTAMTQMNKVVQEGVDAINGNYSSISNAVIQQNVADLYAYDEADFQVDPNVPYNQIPEESIMYIDPNAKVDKEKVDNTEVFENKIDVNDSNNVVLEPLGQGLLENDQTYYRYDINFVAIIVILAVTIYALLSFAVKMVKIIFELAVNKIFGLLVAGADINSGQRTKQVLQNILGLFGSIFMMALSMQVYIELITYSTNSGISIASQVVVLIGGSWALLQGPSIVEKVLGVNAGLNEAGKMLQAGMSMASAGSNIAGGVGKMGTAAAGVAVGASSAAAGIAAGYKAGSEIKQPNSGRVSDNSKSQVTEPNGSKVKTSNPGTSGGQRTAGLDANQKDPSQVSQPNSRSSEDKNANLSNSQNSDDINSTGQSEGNAEDLNNVDVSNVAQPDSNSSSEEGTSDLNNTDVSDVAQPDSSSNSEEGTSDLNKTDVSDVAQPGSSRIPGNKANNTSKLVNPKVKDSSTKVGATNSGTSNGRVEGHKYTRPQNTLLGQSKVGQKMTRTKDQSYNTGYNIGMKFNPNFKKGKGDN